MFIILKRIRLLFWGFFDKYNKSCAYIIAFCVGLSFVLVTFDADFISGQGSFFMKGDSLQHLSGWYAYVRSPWQYPLLHSGILNSPEGVSIAFTDSIPLIAVIMKFFRSFLPSSFNYFGYYVSACFILQAITFVYFSRVCGLKSLFFALFFSLNAVVTPILLNRLGHTSLMSHFLVVLAISFYVKSVIHKSPSYLYLSLIVPIFSFLIHPYLFVMTLAVFFSTVMDCKDKYRIRRVFGLGLFLFIIILFLIKGFGYYGGEKSGGGFDFFSMNLSSPFCGGSVSCIYDKTGGQKFEGYNYFGAGVIFSLILLITLHQGFFSKVKSIFIECKWLIISLLGLFIYSISNKVTFLDYVLLEYNIPDMLSVIVNTFRASGRLFWPVNYAIMLFSFVGVCRLFVANERLARYKFLLVAILFLQIYDMYPKYLEMKSMSKGYTTIIDQDEERVNWSEILHDTSVWLYPNYNCDLFDDRYYLFFQGMVARFGNSINTGYLSRAGNQCNASLPNSHGRDLYILSKKYLKKYPILMRDSFPSSIYSLILDGECYSSLKYVYCLSPKIKADFFKYSNNLNLERFTFSERKATLDAKYFSTQSGHYDQANNRIISNDKEGFFIYGPYISLSKGYYDFKIKLGVKDKDSKKNRYSKKIDVGYYEFVYKSDDSDAKVVYQNPLNNILNNEIKGSFYLDRNVKNFELRIYSKNNTEMIFSQLSLHRK